MKNQVEIILSPLLLPMFPVGNKVVVVIDILRATSTICVALSNGARSVIPVVSTEEALGFKGDYLIAGEREGQKADGFNFGNSPAEYGPEVVSGRDIVLTTTNGTKCIQASREASEILVGSFLNLSVLADYLNRQHRDIVLFCSGWKNKVNLEDTLFAGCLASKLDASQRSNCDSTELSIDLYHSAKDNLHHYLTKASHARRFSRLGNFTDLELCLETDSHPVLVKYQKDRLVTVAKAAG